MKKTETVIETTSEVKKANKSFTITLGAFVFIQNALNFQIEIENRFFVKTYISSNNSKSLYRLNIGTFNFKQEGSKLLKRLKDENVDCYIRKIF